jgi:hypothetical protein
MSRTYGLAAALDSVIVTESGRRTYAVDGLLLTSSEEVALPAITAQADQSLSVSQSASAHTGDSPLSIASAENSLSVGQVATATSPAILGIVGSATGTNTCTIPAHQVGDLIVVFAFRDGNATAAALPSGFTNILTKSGTSCSMRVGYKFATSTNDAAGTWTNATEVNAVVYRGASGRTLAIGASGSNAGTTNTLNFPALSVFDGSGASHVVASAGHRSTDQNLGTRVPSGMGLVVDNLDATAEQTLFETSLGATSWPSTNVNLTGTASGWVSAVIEVISQSPDGWSTTLQDHAWVTYSNGQKTVTWSQGTPTIYSATHRAGGKYYLEIKVNKTTSANNGIGVKGVNSDGPAMIRSTGQLDADLSGLGSVAGFATGDVVGLAIDQDNHKIWFRTNNGLWNNSSSAGPGTGAGGFSIAATDYHVFWYSENPGDQATIYTGSSGFSGSVPAGFVGWDGAVQKVSASASQGVGVGQNAIASAHSSDDVWLSDTPSHDVTLSNANGTATASVVNAEAYSEATLAGSAKRYFELAIASDVVNQFIGAVCPGNSAIGAFWSSNGSIYNGNSELRLGASSLVNGDRVCFAIDTGSNAFWVRKNGGAWIGATAGADPATNTGGFYLGGSVGENYLQIYSGFGASGAATTLAATESDFAFTMPAGFASFGSNEPSSISASVDSSLGVGQVATASVTVSDTASQSVLIQQTVSAQLRIAGYADQSLSVGQGADASAPASETADQSVGIGQSATARLLVSAQAESFIGILQGAASSAPASASATQQLSVTSVAVAQLQSSAGFDQSVGIQQDAIAQVKVSASADQSIAVAQGSYAQTPEQATSGQTVSISQIATASAKASASAEQSLGVGQMIVAGSQQRSVADQSVSIGQEATATVPVKASADQSLGVSQTIGAGAEQSNIIDQSVSIQQDARSVVLVKAAAYQSIAVSSSAAGALIGKSVAAQSVGVEQRATASVKVSASASQMIAIASAAEAGLQIAAAEAGSIGIGQTATSAVKVRAQADQSLSLAQRALSYNALKANAAQGLAIAQDATAAISERAVAGQSLRIAQDAAGTTLVKASAQQTLSLSQVTSSSIIVSAQADQSIGISAGVAARSIVSAQADQSIGIGVEAEGTVDNPTVHANADQAISIAQEASITFEEKGSAAGSVGIQQVAAVKFVIIGSHSSSLGIGQIAVGVRREPKPGLRALRVPSQIRRVSVRAEKAWQPSGSNIV